MGKSVLVILQALVCAATSVITPVAAPAAIEVAVLEEKQQLVLPPYLIYELREDESGEYAVITGIYRKNVTDSISRRWDKYYEFPDTIDGYTIKEIAPDVFREVGVSSVTLPEQIQRIGEGAFADNEELWKVYVPNADCVIGENAFAGCDEEFYICYDENTDGKENPVEEYAKANGLTALEVVDTTGKGVIVNYPESPLVLRPEVRNFFYGENADDEHFDTFEYADDALDYGFEEWHVPCGEFCAYAGGRLEIEASTELFSADDRYAAENLKSLWGRNYTWAEGVADGPGIGEVITYRDSMRWDIHNVWDGLKYKRMDQYGCLLDGYKHYTEICIVNGYAKNQKTWEENGRVKTLIMYVEEEPYAHLELEDTIFPQYFKLPPEDIKVADGDEIIFRFEIADVYPGTLYEDTCLTGLVMEYTGRRGH